MLVIIIITLSLCGYFYYELRLHKMDKNIGVNTEMKDLISNVSRLYLMPTEEDPTIATVSDPNILKNQSFFKLSEKGDKVLIFSKAGKAILYRPSIDKIIEIAPINNNLTSSN